MLSAALVLVAVGQLPPALADTVEIRVMGGPVPAFSGSASVVLHPWERALSEEFEIGGDYNPFSNGDGAPVLDGFVYLGLRFEMLDRRREGRGPTLALSVLVGPKLVLNTEFKNDYFLVVGTAANLTFNYWLTRHFALHTQLVTGLSLPWQGDPYLVFPTLQLAIGLAF